MGIKVSRVEVLSEMSCSNKQWIQIKVVGKVMQFAESR